MRITRMRPDDPDEAWILDRDKEEFGGAGPHHSTVWWTIDGDPENGYAGAYVDVDGVLRHERVWVAPELRGRGAQARFLRARERWGRAQGCSWARTYVHVDGPTIPSMRVLEGAGYRVIAVVIYKGETYLRFGKPLRPGVSRPASLLGA
jgi:GNAT superfamily N-acetyltransferase